MAFESGLVFEDWRSAVIVPLYKGQGESSKYKNYKGIWLFKKIYAGILVDRVSDQEGGV